MPTIDEATFSTLIKSTRSLQGYDEISAMLDNIRPVVRSKNGLRYIDLDSIHAHYNNIYDGLAYGHNVKLREHSRILTLHRFSFYNRFEPKIRDVLQILPLDLPEIVVAFEVVDPLQSADLQQQSVALNHGFHVAQTILYTLD